MLLTRQSFSDITYSEPRKPNVSFKFGLRGF